MRIPKVNLGVNTQGAKHLISEARRAFVADSALKRVKYGKKTKAKGSKKAHRDGSCSCDGCGCGGCE